MPRRERTIVHIVTDDERILQAGRDLPPERFEVTFSATAEDALSAAMQSHPEVAVMELHIGDHGGFSLAREFRDIPGMPEFRLIMLCDRPHDRWLCRQAGAEQVIVKPMADPSELLQALDAVLLPTG